MKINSVIDITQKFFHLRQIDHSFSIPGEAKKFVLEDPSSKGEFNENVRFIAKAAKRNLGEQEILTEYLINCIGMAVLGLNISKSRLGVVRVGTGIELRFMSLFFHGQNERLTHGVQLFYHFYNKEELDRAAKKEERNIYTVEDIKAAFEVLYPSTSEELFMNFLDMCMFDALVGNQDRHAKNWGIIEQVKKSQKASERFAPIFDTARGFFWNYNDEHISKYLKNDSMMGYIIRGIPEISTKSNSKINHFDLVHHIVKLAPSYRVRALKTLQNMEKVDIDAILRRQVFIIGLSGVRRHLIKTCFKLRLGLLKDAVKNEKFNSKIYKANKTS